MIYNFRAEAPADYTAVNQVIKDAFYLEDKPDDFNEWVMVEKIRATPYYLCELSRVAEMEGQIVGHIMFTPMTINSQSQNIKTLALAPVSVKKNFQNQGIGTKLVEEGLKAAKDLGYDSVIVMGHPSYYTRFGFEKAYKWGIGVDENCCSEYLFALELKPGALSHVSGIVTYCPPFYSTDGELI